MHVIVIEWCNDIDFLSLCVFPNREYSSVFEERQAIRQNFRQQCVRRFGRQSAIHYPEDCLTLPAFGEWLRTQVEKRD